MGTLLSRPKAKNQSTRKDVRSAKRPDNPDYGVLALIHKKASKPKTAKPLIDARPEKGKISIAKLYEQRYRPAFSGVDQKAYCGTLHTFLVAFLLTKRFWSAIGSSHGMSLLLPNSCLFEYTQLYYFIFLVLNGMMWCLFNAIQNYPQPTLQRAKDCTSWRGFMYQRSFTSKGTMHNTQCESVLPSWITWKFNRRVMCSPEDGISINLLIVEFPVTVFAVSYAE